MRNHVILLLAALLLAGIAGAASAQLPTTISLDLRMDPQEPPTQAANCWETPWRCEPCIVGEPGCPPPPMTPIEPPTQASCTAFECDPVGFCQRNPGSTRCCKPNGCITGSGYSRTLDDLLLLLSTRVAEPRRDRIE